MRYQTPDVPDYLVTTDVIGPSISAAVMRLLSKGGLLSCPACRRRDGARLRRMLTTPPDLARSALDAAPDAMIIIDTSGSIRFVNRQVAALFGYAHDDLIGQPIELLMPGRYHSRHFGHRQHYVQNVRVRPMGAGLELFGRRRDGSEFPVEVSLSPIDDTDRTLFGAAIRDVTDRKRIEAELIIARESADRANQGKSRFLATASHDLRQPLQALALLNGTLRRVVTDELALEALTQQDQAIGAMSRLLNALLDISKLESGAIQPELADFPVAALLREVHAEFAGIAASKGLQLQIEPCEQVVHSDRALLGQILRNLVSNAVKYTRAGTVSVRALPANASVRVEVIDTGLGIAADEMPLIFDEFYQVGVATNSSREGYGLGLSIVQRLVNLLGLKLEVQSTAGSGSTFALLLPAGARAQARAAPRSTPAPDRTQSLGSVRILLVEDDAVVREATRMLLEVEGYDVTAVETLQQAVGHARAGHGVDLLVSDYHLANGETGVDVVAALRAELGPQLKSVLSTGDTSSAVQELVRDPQLRLASKPIQADELLSLLKALLTA